MPTETSISPKPRSEVLRPSMTRLAPLTWWRRLFRRLIHWLSRLLVFLWTRPKVKGLENIPKRGPALLVSNHLGDADLILGFAYAWDEARNFPYDMGDYTVHAIIGAIMLIGGILAYIFIDE